MPFLDKLRTISLLLLILASSARSEDAQRRALSKEFVTTIRPFLKSYCTKCHSGEKPKAKFDLSPYQSLESVASDFGHWDLVLDRLEAQEMPPEDADKLPDEKLTAKVLSWIKRLRRSEADRNAGDPGPVLARRLSNAEYDYSIHDLTGVDLRPTREFPIDPANEAGFDNTGETLTLSPALLQKYFDAARHVADHLLFRPQGLAFAPHPVVIYSDQDKYCVHRIIDFYQRQPTNLTDYFEAAWRFRHREALQEKAQTLEEIAIAHRLSPKYLKIVWNIFTDSETHAGPILALRVRWDALPSPQAEDDLSKKAKAGIKELSQFVLAARKKLAVPVEPTIRVKGLHSSHQATILWKNQQLADLRQRGNLPRLDGNQQTERLRASIERFCRVFPDHFYVSERGRMFLPPKRRNKGRHLSAGFHMMLGYFRDDAPLYNLILDEKQQQELDTMWDELEFLPDTPRRQFGDFVYLERSESPSFLAEPQFAFVRQDSDFTSLGKIERIAKLYLARARQGGVAEQFVKIVADYFEAMATRIRTLEQHKREAAPRHLEDLVKLAERAWQRPFSEEDRQDLIAFYRSLIDGEGLSHEDAVRDSLVSVLMSPRFFFRSTVPDPGSEETPLTSSELASRLSYFLWSSLPDDELLEAAKNDSLRQPEILLHQTRRLLDDQKVRRLALEFGGNWLDFRRFQSHQGVNRERFSQFTDDLRSAMFEEPVRFLTDLAQNNGSVLDLLEGQHTFVNATLARHYGFPESNLPPNGDWRRVENIQEQGRGGLPGMAVFLTANSPGLRTSPVKRGYWVVRRLLGERIPAPPPQVPDLPEDEAKLGDLTLRQALANHREDPSCASCHERFDAIGLAFEGYGPIGERRTKDQGGRRIDAGAVFPDGSKGDGLSGLRRYLVEQRRSEFIDTLCRKLLSYALGRSLLLSDESTLETMKSRLEKSDFRFRTLIETIVTSPQFLQKRGREHPRR